MPDVGHGAVQGDPVTDVDVEPVLPVRLIHPVGVCEGERLPLFSITCNKDSTVCQAHFTVSLL